MAMTHTAEAVHPTGSASSGSPARRLARGAILSLGGPLPGLAARLMGPVAATRLALRTLRSLPSSAIQGLTWRWVEALPLTEATRELWSRGTFRQGSGKQVRVNPSCLGGRYFVAAGFWEPELSSVMCRQDRQGLLVDIGANYGYFSTLWMEGSQGDARRVISVEPVSEYVALLEENLASYGERARIVAACIGDHDGEGRLDTGGDPTMLSRLVPVDAADGDARTVPVLRLATLLERYGEKEIEVLKVDAEGYDVAILTSCLPLFHSGVVRAVFWESCRDDDREPGLIAELERCGYRPILSGTMLGFERTGSR